MSRQLPTSFTRYEFTVEEGLQSQILSQLQAQQIQTQLAEAAEQKLALAYDGNNPTDFIQQEAYFKGKMEQLQYQLAISESAVKELVELAKQSAASN